MITTSETLRTMIEAVERDPERQAAYARVKAAMANPRAVHVRDRIAAALRYSRVGDFVLGAEHALAKFMFYPDHVRKHDAENADRMLAAFDALGLRLVDEWSDEP